MSDRDLFDEPDEQAMMHHAMAVPLDIKIPKLIAFLQEWSRIRGDIVVCNSGGKDSGVLMHAAKMAGIPFTSIYSVTTLDPPELIAHLKKHYPETKWIRQKKALLTRLQDVTNGPPSRKQRWCCQEYKEMSDGSLTKLIGVRAEESKRRAGLWREVVVDRFDKSKLILCPILYWTEKDVWEYHARFNVPYCSLYDEGFGRLGCIGCPLISQQAQAKEFARWPRYKKLWHDAVCAFWDKWHDLPLERRRFVPKDRLSKYWPREDLQYDIHNGVEGYWTIRRYSAAYKTAEDFWRWWLNEAANKDDVEMCQGQAMFAMNESEEV